MAVHDFTSERLFVEAPLRAGASFQATPEQAVAHPNWAMGAKISVDSATLMNKGLEVIEAHWLFNAMPSQIDVVVHPQSVIHSMVEYIDGSMLAQLGNPDMRTPIAYALGWPKRIDAPADRLDFSKIKLLTFEAPDAVRFPALRIARQVLKAGGGTPAVLNAANEAAVERFRQGQIPFGRIAALAGEVLERSHRPGGDFQAPRRAQVLGICRHPENPTLEDLLACDAWARAEVDRCIQV